MDEPSQTSSGLDYFEPSEVDADAVQVGEAAPLDARQPSRYGRQVGAGTAGGYFGVRTEEEATEALAYFASYCRDCRLEDRCPGDACAIYRAEKEALTVLGVAHPWSRDEYAVP